jgi:hypothetical protein
MPGGPGGPLGGPRGGKPGGPRGGPCRGSNATNQQRVSPQHDGSKGGTAYCPTFGCVCEDADANCTCKKQSKHQQALAMGPATNEAEQRCSSYHQWTQEGLVRVVRVPPSASQPRSAPRGHLNTSTTVGTRRTHLVPFLELLQAVVAVHAAASLAFIASST